MASKSDGSGFKKLEERKVEDAGTGYKVVRKDFDDGADTNIFHAYDGKENTRGAKEAREGWVNADDVLKLSFAAPQRADDDRGSKGGKGGKGDRRSKDSRGNGKGNKQGGKRNSGPGFNAALDNDAAFPSLGA